MDDYGLEPARADEAAVGAMFQVVGLETIKHLSHLISSASPVLQLLLTALRAMSQLLLVHSALSTVRRTLYT